MGPWASSVQCMGLGIPNCIMAIIRSTLEYFYERFNKGTYTKGQLYNTCSMDITCVPLFSQLFQNFQESGLKQNENFYFQAPEEE